MWTEHERDELSVWADQLQAQGEPLGELITTSLALEARSSARSRDEDEGLRERLAALEAEVHRPLVEELFVGFPELEPSWEHGMLVALRVVDHPLGRRLGQAALDSLRKLLRLPVARFLRYLRVDARALDWAPVHREVPTLLVEPDVVARPWVVVLGAPPRHLRRSSPVAVLDADAERLIDLERGLRSLFLDTVRIDLPWHRGDKPARRLAATKLGEANELERESVDLTRIARALWDPSLRVRMATIDAVPLLGRHAAALVPELLLVDRGPLEWVTRVREVLDTLGRNPVVVEAVARNFTADQSRCAGWLAANPMAVARHSAPRIATMLHPPRPIEGWARRELEQARRGMNYRASVQHETQRLDARSPTGQPLLKRIRRLLGS